jgi:hypothetical protein
MTNDELELAMEFDIPVRFLRIHDEDLVWLLVRGFIPDRDLAEWRYDKPGVDETVYTVSREGISWRAARFFNDDEWKMSRVRGETKETPKEALLDLYRKLEKEHEL